ncbi:AMP-binding protein [Nocardia aobensis]|uniref:AMP-binding protein n=1 Tax=Nocardia aobensis TaxID=257277 RepID=A0ABW6P9R9_9NOCA
MPSDDETPPVRYDRAFHSIPNIVRVNARRWPDVVAIKEGSREWTYAALERDVIAGIRGMVAAGVEPGDRIALCGPNSASWIIVALSIQGAGAVLVPINTRFKGQEVHHALRRSGAEMLVTVTDFLGNDYVSFVRAVDPEFVAPGRVIVYSGAVPPDAGSWSDLVRRGLDSCEEEAALTRLDTVGPDDISDIMFTSGTTGLPKGVVLTHGQSLRAFGWYASVLTFRFGDRYPIIPPFFHSFGYKAGWMACLLHGVTIYPVAVFDAESFVQLAERERISILMGPPAVFHDLLGLTRSRNVRLPELRVVMISAAAVPPALFRRVRDELDVPVMASSYGQTECTALATTTHPGTDTLDDIATTVGRAALDVEIRVVDTSGTPLPPGLAGEVLIRGYTVMRGYWNDPDATAEVVDADGWLHTGDIGVLDDRGLLRIVDRKKDMYIAGGFNVYPAEVENILSTYPAISEIAVVGVPDPRMGEVGAAFVVPKPGTAFDQENFLAWARRQIANFKVPAHVVVLAALPRNAGGKVAKNSLREQFGTPRGR